jgi:hypothetical protein
VSVLNVTISMIPKKEIQKQESVLVHALKTFLIPGDVRSVKSSRQKRVYLNELMNNFFIISHFLNHSWFSIVPERMPRYDYIRYLVDDIDLYNITGTKCAI